MARKIIIGVIVVVALAMGLGLALKEKHVHVQAGDYAESCWRAGEDAFADGNMDVACKMYMEHYNVTGDQVRFREAFMRFVKAGDYQHAGDMARMTEVAELSRLGEAVDLFQASPPMGYEDDPYVIDDIAGAIGVLRSPVPPVAAVEPVRLSADHLAELVRTWQVWLAYALDDSAAGVRTMVLWCVPAEDVPAAVERGHIVHRVGPESVVVVQMGSRGLAVGRFGRDIVATIDTPGPAEFWLGAFTDDGRRLSLVVQGERIDGCFVVDGCRGVEQYSALLAMLADAKIQPGLVEPADAAERQAIIDMADCLGLADSLAIDTTVLAALDVSAGQTDYANDGQWLADIAGYIRHGRTVVAAAASALMTPVTHECEGAGCSHDDGRSHANCNHWTEGDA